MQISLVFADSPNSHHTVTLQSVLGQGKFHVYHAKSDSLPDSDFALKVFPKDSVSSTHFAREHKFLSKLSHPNIITFIPVISHDLPYDLLITEYTPNGDFFEFVAQGGFCNEKLRRTYFHQLIEGVEYLHAQGVAHLDLKLENLLLDKNYNLKILDFDQTQSVEDRELYSGGTGGYRAPELLKGRFEDLKALDMYAVGVLLYVFLTGEMPFLETEGENGNKAVSYRMFKEERERFWREKSKGLGITFEKEVKELLNGLWEEDPKKRFKVEDVKRSKWYDREVYGKEELRREVKGILGRTGGL